MAIKTDSTVDDPEMLGDGTQYIPEYRPPDYEVIGADGGLFTGGLGQPTGNLADVLRTDIEYAPGYYPGQGVYVNESDADRLGLGGNIFLSNPNWTGFLNPISTQPTGPAAPAQTPQQIADAAQQATGWKPAGRADENTLYGQIYNQRLDILNQQRAKNNQLPIGTLDTEILRGLADDAMRGVEMEISGQEVDVQRAIRAQAVAAKNAQTGIPLILPIPGLDPATAAILTAAGIIFSGGKISTINPQNPVGSVAGAVQGVGQTGQNIIDVITGDNTLENIWSGGTAPAGSTGGPTGGAAGAGQQTTGTGAVGILGGGILGGGTSSGGSTTGGQQTTSGGSVAVTGGALGGQAGGTAAPGSTGGIKPGGDMPATGGPYIFDSSERTQNILGQILAPSQAIQQQKAEQEAGRNVPQSTPVVSTSNDNLPTPQEGPEEIAPVDNTQNADNTTTCPAPETPILLADGTQISAGELQVGMVVRTAHETTGEWGNYAITRVSIVKDKRLRFVLNDGAFICSPTHKFSTGSGWKQAKDYRAGDALQHRTVVSVHDHGDGNVVSITVDGAHTYVSDGLLSHNKTPIFLPPPSSNTTNEPVRQDTPIIVPPPNPPPVTSTTTTTTPTGTAATPIVINAPTVGYTLPGAGTPVQRNLYTEAGTTLASLASPMQRFQIGVDAQGNAIYGTVPSGQGGGPATLSEAIAGGYGGLAQGMTQQDITNLLNSIRAQTGTQVGPDTKGGYQSALTEAANAQTAAANTALRTGNITDAEALAARAQALRQAANPALFGQQGALPQYTQQAQEQVSRDIAALRSAEAGNLTPEQIRNAQQAAREAYGARGQVFSQGAAAQEVLNRQAAIQQQQQLARQNLAQSMGQLGQGVAYQTANIFDPMAAVLGGQYGMQSQNVGMNQALYNQAMGLTSGAGGYGFAQQMINPFTGYAQDVYGTNVNAVNAAQIAAANRQAALEAAKMGQTGTYAQALGNLIASGGLGQIQSGITGGVQGLLSLLGGKWPTS